jgi:ketosteroid isomerase-like protein
METWVEGEATVDRLVDSGSGRIGTVITFHARGRASGVEVSDRFGYVFDYRSGWITRVELYENPEEALASVSA